MTDTADQIARLARQDASLYLSDADKEAAIAARLRPWCEAGEEVIRLITVNAQIAHELMHGERGTPFAGCDVPCCVDSRELIDEWKAKLAAALREPGAEPSGKNQMTIQEKADAVTNAKLCLPDDVP